MKEKRGATRSACVKARIRSWKFKDACDFFDARNLRESSTSSPEKKKTSCPLKEQGNFVGHEKKKGIIIIKIGDDQEK